LSIKEEIDVPDKMMPDRVLSPDLIAGIILIPSFHDLKGFVVTSTVSISRSGISRCNFLRARPAKAHRGQRIDL
jgi:hypothetical protein